MTIYNSSYRLMNRWLLFIVREQRRVERHHFHQTLLENSYKWKQHIPLCWCLVALSRLFVEVCELEHSKVISSFDMPVWFHCSGLNVRIHKTRCLTLWSRVANPCCAGAFTLPCVSYRSANSAVSAQIALSRSNFPQSRGSVSRLCEKALTPLWQYVG